MTNKKKVLSILGEARLDLKELISMVENDTDIFQIHELLNKTILRLEEAKKVMLSRYLGECLDKFYKNNNLGRKSRQEVINLFQN